MVAAEGGRDKELIHAMHPKMLHYTVQKTNGTLPNTFYLPPKDTMDVDWKRLFSNVHCTKQAPVDLTVALRV